MNKSTEANRGGETAGPAGGPATRTPTPKAPRPAQPDEIGGPAWPEPTRYGDWERGGRVSDF